MTQASVRVRTTVGALVVVGSALVVSAIAIVLLLQRTIEDNIRDAARLRAGDFVALLESGTAPGELDIRLEEDVFVQIVDALGRVAAASPSLEDAPPAARMSEDESTVVTDPKGGNGAFLVVSRVAETDGGPFDVLVGRNLSAAQETTRVVVVALAVAVPLLLVIVGLATWSTAGLALAPVESIRTEVAAISGSELHRRVPEAAGDDEIARLARTMNDMLERLERAHSKQQRLVSDVSHELRNPLAAIRQYVEVALAHPEHRTVAELADEVLPESLRLQRIADDLLFLARADEDTLRMDTSLVDLGALVNDEVNRLRTSSIPVDAENVRSATIEGDPTHLQRLVRNLADNAARHANALIRFAVATEGNEVHVHVDDDGPGIPEEARTTVFERFTRVDPSRDRDGGGAGLGLAIVAEIVAAHRGSVSVTDSPLGGARFAATFPAAR